MVQTKRTRRKIPWTFIADWNSDMTNAEFRKKYKFSVIAIRNRVIRLRNAGFDMKMRRFANKSGKTFAPDVRIVKDLADMDDPMRGADKYLRDDVLARRNRGVSIPIIAELNGVSIKTVRTIIEQHAQRGL